MAISLDMEIMHFVNAFSRHSLLFDLFMVRFLDLRTLKLMPIVACMIWIWFDDRHGGVRRWQLGQALCGAMIALLVSRLTQNLMPYTPRPIYSPELGFVPPFGVTGDVLHDWSSFPSDTSALAFALAAGVWRASRRLGLFSFVWALVFVGFARVYAGYHYPSDVIAGAAIGIASVAVAAWAFSERLPGLRALHGLVENRPLFYVTFFVVMFQVVTILDDVRIASRGLVDFLEGEEVVDADRSFDG